MRAGFVFAGDGFGVLMAEIATTAFNIRIQIKDMKLNSFLVKSLAGGWLLLALVPGLVAQPAAGERTAALSNATILIIRHAEKPASGLELAPAGVARAQAYPAYFKNLSLAGVPVKVDAVFATADSKGSHRPRLTIEPTAKALGLPVDSRFADKNFAALADELKAKPHGRTLLVCWHHGEIPSLAQALGADPAKLLPGGKWPNEVFGWMIVLRYDAAGHLTEEKCLNEHLMPDDGQ